MVRTRTTSWAVFVALLVALGIVGVAMGQGVDWCPPTVAECFR